MDPVIAVAALLGIFAGVALRTVAPALRKIREAAEAEEGFRWDHRYTVTALISLTTAFAATMIALPTFAVPEGGPYLVFSSAFIFGSGLNTIINEVQAWFS